MTIYVFGRLNIDTVLMLESSLNLGEKNLVREVRREFGGSGGNAAVAIRRFLDDRRVVVRIVGCVGSDSEGLDYVEYLRMQGIDVSMVRIVEGASTGRAFVLIEPSGRSTIATFPGANNLCTDIPRIESAELCLVMNPPISVLEGVVKQCIEQRALIVVDLGSSWRAYGRYVTRMLRGYEKAILVPNEFELLSTWSGTLEHVLESLCSELGSGTIVVKRGPRGALVRRCSNGLQFVVDAPNLEEMGMKIVSTAGCGDVFTAVLATSILTGFDLREAVLYAVAAASLKATRMGVQNVPSKTEIEKLVERLRRGSSYAYEAPRIEKVLGTDDCSHAP